jgi:hypothetical protein
MRLKFSVVLISSDLPTITRKGADPCGVCDGGGKVVVWVVVGAWVCAATSGLACCSISEKAGAENAVMVSVSRTPSRNARTFIF